jgi:hydroxymethylbilane synthase
MSVVSSPATTLIIGSRGSQLALWQANYIASRLSGLGVGARIEIIKTTGDHLQTASLVQAGGKGLFTKEIEEALLSGTIDLAVHSLKDLPTDNPEGLTIAAIPEREDPRDAIVGCPLAELKHGARVGTSSGRRGAQLLNIRPDLNVEPIRGNVDTRLRKLREGQFDAILLAAAGLRRLGLEREIAQTFSPDEICPAPGQGALAIQTRTADLALELCSALNDRLTAECVRCERAVLAALGGGCQLPVGVFAEAVDESLCVRAAVLSLDGRRAVHKEMIGPRTNPEQVGALIAGELLRAGAGSILSSDE